MEPTSADEAIEVFGLVVGDLLRTAGFKADKERIRTIKDLDGAAIMLREVWLTICSVAQEPEVDIRAALEEMDIAAIHAAAQVVADIAREPDEHPHQELTDRYSTVRRFLPKLLKHLDFDAGAALEATGQGVRPGHEVLKAIDFLRAIERRRTDIAPEEVPADFLTSAWHRRVFPKRGEFAGTFDKQAYTLAAVERLRESLRRHEVFVPGLRNGPDRGRRRGVPPGRRGAAV